MPRWDYQDRSISVVGVDASQRRCVRGLSNKLIAAQTKDRFDCIEGDKMIEVSIYRSKLDNHVLSEQNK